MTDHLRTSIIGSALVVAVVVAMPLRAQEVTPPVPVPRDSASLTAEPSPSPAGAFVRSLLVPGWGQAAHGAYVRGGVFFTLQSGSWFMLIKTMAKLAEAREIEVRRVGEVRDSLLALAADSVDLSERYADPELLELDVQDASERDERVNSIRPLVRAREEQREDWIAMTIFVTLMGGVDALVNAHLSDFPVRVDVTPESGRRVSVGLTIPTGAPR